MEYSNSKKPRVVAVIQARMGSTRLPEKVMKPILGKPMIMRILERVHQSNLIDEIVVATSTNHLDNPLTDYLSSSDTAYFRGSEEDVLERYYFTARAHNADIVVRLTGDNPLVDSQIIDATIQYYTDTKQPYVSSLMVTPKIDDLPLGMGCEVFSFALLEEAYNNAHQDYEREHVTPYMYLNKQLEVPNPSRQPYRLTVDTDKDFECITQIYNYLYPTKPNFHLNDILECLAVHPDIAEINADVIQKKIR